MEYRVQFAGAAGGVYVEARAWGPAAQKRAEREVRRRVGGRRELRVERIEDERGIRIEAAADAKRGE